MHGQQNIKKRHNYVSNILKLNNMSTGEQYVNAKYIGCKVNRFPTSSHETIITSQTESQFPLRNSTKDTVTNDQLQIKWPASRQAYNSWCGKTILVHSDLMTSYQPGTTSTRINRMSWEVCIRDLPPQLWRYHSGCDVTSAAEWAS